MNRVRLISLVSSYFQCFQAIGNCIVLIFESIWFLSEMFIKCIGANIRFNSSELCAVSLFKGEYICSTREPFIIHSTPKIVCSIVPTAIRVNQLNWSEQRAVSVARHEYGVHGPELCRYKSSMLYEWIIYSTKIKVN